MKRRLFTATLGLVMILAVAVPVFAIVNGEVDTANEYPNVGAIVITKQPAGAKQVFNIPQTHSSCTLVHPRVVLTAGHSVESVRGWIANHPDVALSDFAVTFSPSVYDVGAAQHGISEMRIHPGYSAPGSTSIDVGLIILTNPVSGIMPVTLPNSGFLADLDLDRGPTASKPNFAVVGYGTTEVPKTVPLLPPGVRRVAQSTFKSLRTRHLMLSQNFALGEGGFSRGDSGGAAFWTLSDGSLVQVGITGVHGDAASVSYGGCLRTDLSSVLAFIQDAIDDATE
jgi:hypothetical protein